LEKLLLTQHLHILFNHQSHHERLLLSFRRGQPLSELLFSRQHNLLSYTTSLQRSSEADTTPSARDEAEIHTYTYPLCFILHQDDNHCADDRCPGRARGKVGREDVGRCFIRGRHLIKDQKLEMAQRYDSIYGGIGWVARSGQRR